MDKEKSGIPHFLKISLNIMIVTGILVFIWVVYKSFSSLLELYSLKMLITFILLLIGGLSLICMLFNLRRIISSLIKKTPFTWSNVRSLRMIAIFSLIIAICYGTNILINKQYIGFTIVSIDINGIHTNLEFLIFFFAACFIFVLSQVFKQAIEFKEENDLTI